VTRRGRIALKVGAWAACLAPLAALGYWVATDNLTANPISFITNHLGDWTFRMLLAALAMTPLRILTGWGWPALLRRLLGLFTFFYAVLHFSVWILIDHFFNWSQMAEDIVKRPYITVGMLGLTLMIPLAVTSTAGMVRRLGARNWKRLHRLVYVTGICAALHFLWLAKVGRHDQYVHVAVLGVLLGVRGIDWARRAVRRRAPGSTLVPRTLVVLALVVLTGCVQSPGGLVNPVGGHPTRTVLSNGVVLIVHEHRAAEVVALQLWMRVGGRDEAPQELGLSHYLEHMLFKGTPTRPPGSIDALIEGLGGQSNAYTSYDYTHYDVVLPAEHVRAGIELLADIAMNASFEQSELDAERKVVLEEMRLTEDNPDRFMLRRLYELAYMPHPYGRPILGTPQLIGGLTRERLRAYYK
jgi:sulfoxide reductase heme-binding subunit YedZ